jgi:multidrug transporter EmrE-like cation transporter
MRDAGVAKGFMLKAFVLGWGMVFLYVVFNSYGALTLKTQVQKLGVWNFTTARSYFSYFFALFSRLQTWLGLGAICIATGAWVVALAHLELSRAYPVAVGLNLLIIVGLALLYFHEPLTLPKILGLSLIIGGVIILFR